MIDRGFRQILRRHYKECRPKYQLVFSKSCVLYYILLLVSYTWILIQLLVLVTLASYIIHGRKPYEAANMMGFLLPAGDGDHSASVPVTTPRTAII